MKRLMRLMVSLLFILFLAMPPFARATCGESLKQSNVARRVVQVGGAALGLWIGGAFLNEEDPDEFDPGYDYERIEMLRRKKAAEGNSNKLLVNDTVKDAVGEKIN